MSAVWFIMTQVRAKPDSAFQGPKESVIYVECYVPGRSIHAALELARQALNDEGYELQDVTRCFRFDLEDWDEDAYPFDSEARILVERIAQTAVVEFGVFCCAPPGSD